MARVSSIADGLVSQCDDFKTLITKARQTLREREAGPVSDPLLNNNNSINHNNNNTNDEELPCTSDLEESPQTIESENEGGVTGGGLDRLIMLTPGKSVNTSEITRSSAGIERTSVLSTPPDSVTRLHPVLPKFGAKGQRRRRNTMFSRSDV